MARPESHDPHSGHVGSGSRLSGRLHAPGPFVVNGAFKGEIHSEDVVSVGSAGTFDGRILADQVTVEDGGRVSGEIEAQTVVVRAGGSISGVTVQAASLTLEADSDADGARFQIRRDFQRARTDDGASPNAASAPTPPAPNSAS